MGPNPTQVPITVLRGEFWLIPVLHGSIVTSYIYYYMISKTEIFKDAVQVHLHFTYNVLRCATVWSVLSKHDSISQSGNTLHICTIISEIS